MQSIPGPGEQPQTFETVEEVVARPEWNAIPASQTLPHTFRTATRPRTSPGTGAQPQARRRDPARRHRRHRNERWDVRIADGRRRVDGDRRAHARRLGPGLGSVSPHVDPAPTPTSVRPAQAARRLRPQRAALGARCRRTSSRLPRRHRRRDRRLAGLHDLARGAERRRPRRLASRHRRRARGSCSRCPTTASSGRWRRGDRAELAPSFADLRARSPGSRSTSGENYASFGDQVRDVTVFAVSEPLTLVGAARTRAPVAGDWLDVDVDVSAMAPGRTLIVRGTTTAGEDHAEEARREGGRAPTATSGGSRSHADLSTAYERDSVIVHGNVALATHGETVQQLLGSGRASSPSSASRSRMTRSRTSSRATTRRGAVDTLDVRVNDVSVERGADAVRRRLGRPGVRAAHRRGRFDVRPVRRRRRAARGCRPGRTTCARRTATASVPPATSMRARLRSSSIGRSASRA